MGNGVFLLSAPPGYGKTTVMSEWAQASSIPVAWYHLEEVDDYAIVFARGIVRALSPLFPRATWRIEEVLQQLPAGALTPTDLTRLQNALIDDLRRVVSRPTALALTNVTALSVGRQAHALLSALLADSPIRYASSSKSATIPRLPLSPLFQDQRVAGLGRDSSRLPMTSSSNCSSSIMSALAAGPDGASASPVLGLDYGRAARDRCWSAGFSRRAVSD